MVRQWAAISFGEGHAAGVSGEGEVFTWGKNDLGQVGQNVGHDKDVPTKMEILKGWDVRALACGAHHTVALTPEDVISWGANSEGQCGQGERAETLWVKPRSIKPLQGMYVSQVVCGKYHTLCVTATSQVQLLTKFASAKTLTLSQTPDAMQGSKLSLALRFSSVSACLMHHPGIRVLMTHLHVSSFLCLQSCSMP